MKLKIDPFFKWLMLSAALVFFSHAVLAQRTITGKVTDAQTNEPLIGTNIVATGTTVGTAADLDGNFTLEVPAAATELIISYVGYDEQRLTLGASNVINIALVAGAALEEIVVIGYGTVRKEDATGAVNAVSSKDFNRGIIVSADQLIVGKVAGVQITSNSSEPGGSTSIRIRGGTSVNASNELLYVIDDVPFGWR